MMPEIISAFLMSLTLSLDDYVITSFVTGAGFRDYITYTNIFYAKIWNNTCN